MKTLYKSIFYLVLVLAPMLFSRCALSEDISKIQDSLDSIKIIVGTPEFNTLVHFEFVDAKTREYITDVVSVTVTGKNASIIYNNIGQQSAAPASYSSIVGMLDLVADPHQVDTTTLNTKPIEFDVTTSLAGYVNVTQRININENKSMTVVIPLINLQDPPDGVTVNQQDQFALSDVNGALISPAIAALNSGAQTVEIPQGVILKDASGNPVTGTIKSQIIFFNPTVSSAQASIPGGLNVNAKLADGTTGNIQFVSAGMYGVSLSSGNQQVKTIENGGLRIKTKVDPAIINLNTGVQIKENDVIELWSKVEGTGEWKFEKMDTVRKVGADLVLEESVKHLSLWNWDYFQNSCDLGAKIIFKGNVLSVDGIVSTNVYYWDCHITQDFTAIPGDSNYGFIQLYQVPLNTHATLKFVPKDPDITFNPDSLIINNLCEGTYEVTINRTYTLTVKIDLKLISANQPKLVIKPTTTIYLRQSGGKAWTKISVKKGVCSLSIKTETDYEIMAMFGKESKTAKLRVDNTSNNMVFITCTPIVKPGQIATPVTYHPIPLPVNKIVSQEFRFELLPETFNQMH